MLKLSKLLVNENLSAQIDFPSQLKEIILNAEKFLNKYNILSGKILNSAIKLLYENQRLFFFYKNIREYLDNYGYLIVNNLPIDEDLTDNPLDKITKMSEAILLLLSAEIGKPKNYLKENSGHYIHNIKPKKKSQFEQTGNGSYNDLELHNEIAFDYNKPDYLILLSLKSGEEVVPTYISSIGDSIRHCPLSIKENLYQEDFFIRTPHSFSSGSEEPYYRRSLIKKSNNGSLYFFNFNQDIIVPINTKAQFTLNTIKQIFYKNIQQVFLTPGTAIIIDNNKFLHGRPAFNSSFDGNDRWLQRIYLQKN